MIIKNKQNEFKTVWLKERSDSTSAHQLFIKLHSVKRQEPEYPKGQTLFILNVPPTASEQHFQQMISEKFPSVSLVKFVSQPETHPSSFRNAYVVFQKEEELKKFFALPDQFVFTIYDQEESAKLFGLRKWCKEYNQSITKESKLKEEVEKYMKKYDKNIKTKEKEEENVDEDGWVTVSAKKKRGKSATARKESVMKKLKDKNEIKKKKELVNIYAFQVREAKKQRLVELRKKFELDKAKILQYKQKRKFKPL